MYRVGPLARLNVIDRPGTTKADREWTEFLALRAASSCPTSTITTPA